MEVSEGFVGLSQNCHRGEDVCAFANEAMAYLLISSSSPATYDDYA